MLERTRYRISGSLFLLALAVIFIPMVFDGGGYPNEPIPAMPAAVPDNRIASFDEVVPVSNVEQEVAELRAEVDEFGFSTTTGEKFGEPILVPETPATSIWAVQAASFAKVDNARGLRAALRAAGMEAFISTAVDPTDDESSPLHRVAVGPLLDRADAATLAEKISAGFDVQPQLVEMQP